MGRHILVQERHKKWFTPLFHLIDVNLIEHWCDHSAAHPQGCADMGRRHMIRTLQVSSSRTMVGVSLILHALGSKSLSRLWRSLRRSVGSLSRMIGSSSLSMGVRDARRSYCFRGDCGCASQAPCGSYWRLIRFFQWEWEGRSCTHSRHMASKGSIMPSRF